MEETTESWTSLRAEHAAHVSWAKTGTRAARLKRTAPCRQAAEERFAKQAREMHPDASDTEIVKIAANLRAAHFKLLAFKSVQARRRKKEAS